MVRAKKPTPFLTLCQTPEDHISKKAWVAFGGHYRYFHSHDAHAIPLVLFVC